MAGECEHAEAEEQRDDDVVLAVEGDELQADGAGDVERGCNAHGGLGGEEPRGAEPYGEDEALGEDGEEDDRDGRVPEKEETGVEEGVKRGVAGWEVAIRQPMLHEGVRFSEVEGGDVAARWHVQREEDAEEDEEAREDEGEIRGAVEGAASEAVDGIAVRRDVTRDGEDATKRGPGLKALDAGHPSVR